MSTDKNFDIFKKKLNAAVDKALANPNPTTTHIKNNKAYFMHGLTVGQYDIVIRTYNSTLKRIKYLNK